MFNNELLKEAIEYEKKLLNFFWRQGVNINGAEDLVQETYLRLWKYSDRYKKTAKLSTFLFILARQVLIDSYRRESSRVNREEAYSEKINQVEPPKVSCVAEDVRWAVSQLSPPLREVVELGFFQELPYKEVAEILSIPIGTVKSRMSNALKRLKEVFNDRGL